MIDIGVNLTHASFEPDLDQVLQDAFGAGLEAMILTGTDLDSSQASLALCQQFAAEASHGALYCTAGVHPHDADHWDAETAETLRELLAHPLVVAVGETGLDFNRNFSSREGQIEAFEHQLELSAETGKPLFLHERDAWAEQSQILRRCLDDIGQAVVHCFTGDLQALEDYLDMGLYVGITGWVCDERRGTGLAEIVSRIPLDRLLIETDAPFLLPRNIEPKPSTRRNEPAFLPWVVRKLAECYQVSEFEIAARTRDNAKRLFALPVGSPG